MPTAPRIVALVVALLLSGCASYRESADAFDACGGDRSFYVVNHGWHAGLVVDAEPLTTLLPALKVHFDDSGYLELGWGDAHFYRAPEPGVGLALAAALWPTGAVLHVASFPTPQSAGPDPLEFKTDEAGFRRLLTFVASSFAQMRAGDLEHVGRGIYADGQFYRAVGSFHLLNTCNTWVAKAVRESGVPLPGGPVITADALMRRLQAFATSTADCPRATPPTHPRHSHSMAKPGTAADVPLWAKPQRGRAFAPFGLRYSSLIGNKPTARLAPYPRARKDAVAAARIDQSFLNL